jgi:hypothetical protein
METIFKGKNILEFVHAFSSDERPAEFIVQEKWKNSNIIGVSIAVMKSILKSIIIILEK